MDSELQVLRGALQASERQRAELQVRYTSLEEARANLSEEWVLWLTFLNSVLFGNNFFRCWSSEVSWRSRYQRWTDFLFQTGASEGPAGGGFAAGPGAQEGGVRTQWWAGGRAKERGIYGGREGRAEEGGGGASKLDPEVAWGKRSSAHCENAFKAKITVELWDKHPRKWGRLVLIEEGWRRRRRKREGITVVRVLALPCFQLSAGNSNYGYNFWSEDFILVVFHSPFWELYHTYASYHRFPQVTCSHLDILYYCMFDVSWSFLSIAKAIKCQNSCSSFGKYHKFEQTLMPIAMLVQMKLLDLKIWLWHDESISRTFLLFCKRDPSLCSFPGNQFLKDLVVEHIVFPNEVFALERRHLDIPQVRPDIKAQLKRKETGYCVQTYMYSIQLPTGKA